MKLKYLCLFTFGFFIFLLNVGAYKAPVDITQMDIYDLQKAMDNGYLSSELLVNLYLERIEKYDDLFNSINQVSDNAIEEAKKLDEERRSGKVRSKLHGIPILVKTNIDVVGLATTAGTKDLKDNFPKEDAYVIKKMKEAGAIILGSTNMSELAFSASNSYSSYGYVRNAFNVDYTSFGSSGGSAVAVAVSFAAASLGTDTNSSVRVPASGAGLVGMRPTLGLVSRNGVIPYDIERDTVGVLTKSVRDSSLILSIISGEDNNDKYTSDATKYDHDELGEKELSDYTIGVINDFMYGTDGASVPVNGVTDPVISPLLDKSLEQLKNAGANIVYIDKFLTSKYYSIATSTYAGITMCDTFNEYIKGTKGSVRSFEELVKSPAHVQSLNGYLPGCDGNYLDKSVRDEKKDVYRDYVDSVFEKYDVDLIIYPTLKNKVFEYKKTGIVSPSSSMSSVIGYPSLTVPMGVASDGFSYGLEFMAKSYQEDILYNVALAYEDAMENALTNSSLTPSLYEVDSNVQILIELYENSSVLRDNKDLYESIGNYLKDYSDVSEDEAKNLVEQYEQYVTKLERDKYFRVIGIVLGCLIFLFIFTRKKKKRRRKKVK